MCRVYITCSKVNVHSIYVKSKKKEAKRNSLSQRYMILFSSLHFYIYKLKVFNLNGHNKNELK